MLFHKNLVDDYDLSDSVFNAYFPILQKPICDSKNSRTSSWYLYLVNLFRILVNLPWDLYFLTRLHIYLHYVKKESSKRKYTANVFETVGTDLSQTHTHTPTHTHTKLISWNLQFGNGFLEVDTFDNMVGFLQHENPSICVLQEVMKCENINQVEILGSRLNKKNRLFTPNFKYNDMEVGNLILSNYPFKIITRHAHYQLVSVTQVDNNYNSDTIYLFNIHLPSDITCMYQKKIISELIKEIEKIEGIHSDCKSNYNSDIENTESDLIEKTDYKIIMCGDFNLLPWCHEMGKLKTKIKPVENYEYTFPSNYPLLRFDYMFANKLSYNFKIGRVKFSDHLPLILNFSCEKSN